MPYSIELTEEAVLDLKHLRKHDQATILAGIEKQLQDHPATETGNRKPLRPNDLSSWEVRIGKHRVFYDIDGTKQAIIVKAIGWKEHNTLFIRGQEYQL